jgi:hypothetical protein
MSTYTLDATEIENKVNDLITETLNSGGATLSLNGQLTPNTGYMVGGVQNRAFNRDMFTWANVFDFVAGVMYLLDKDRYFLGSWIDDETGLIWVDVAELSLERSTALELAAARDEIAIWDNRNQEEIRV